MSETVLDQARVLHRTIRRLQTRVLARSARAEPDDGSRARELTLPQVTTLLAVRDVGALGIKALSEATHVSAPSASAMVDRLVEAGLLWRENSRTDRREVRVSLTPEGAGAVGLLEEYLLKSLTEMLEKVGPGLAADWCKVYARINEILDDEDGGSSLGQVAPRSREAKGSTVT